MKRSYWCIAFLGTFLLTSLAQEKPQVFLQGQGPEGSGDGNGKRWGVLGSKSSANGRGEATEFGKFMEQDCAQAVLTQDRANSDYTVTLTSVAPKKHRDLRASGQVQVTNRAGKSVGTNFLHTSGNAAKDACELIEADWKAHGKVPEKIAAGTGNSEPTPGVTMAPKPAAASAVPVAGTESITTRFQTGSSTSVAAGGSTAGEDMGEAARRAKQHAACLKASKENPSITCK